MKGSPVRIRASALRKPAQGQAGSTESPSGSSVRFRCAEIHTLNRRSAHERSYRTPGAGEQVRWCGGFCTDRVLGSVSPCRTPQQSNVNTNGSIRFEPAEPEAQRDDPTSSRSERTTEARLHEAAPSVGKWDGGRRGPTPVPSGLSYWSTQSAAEAIIGHSRSGSARYSGLRANDVIRAVPAVFVPWAIIADPGADADWASRSQRPLRKKPVNGRLPSTVIVEGTAVNQVGGSTIAVSRERYAPVIGLVPGAELSQ